MTSTASKLRSDFDKLVENLSDLISTVPIVHFNQHHGSITIVAPKHNWGGRNTEQQSAQLRIKQHYEEWFQLFKSLFRHPTNELQKKIKHADENFRTWLEFKMNWRLENDPKANRSHFIKNISAFYELLDVFTLDKVEQTIIIPDTNSIVEHPDPTNYRTLAGTPSFYFLLLPTILAELDKLKNLHKNPDFRDKAKKTIQRIKGWRKQGSLRDGVTVDKTISIQAIANEPQMENSLSWLDPNVPDDRLIAGILEVQATYPKSQVILVTGDINLLNKAEAARISTYEFQEYE